MVFLSKSYSWGSGVKYSVPADVVGHTLEGIEERDGKVTKKAFLEESRPEDAPTHSMFEWNDAIAAEKYRMVQSGKIINNLVVTVHSEEREEPITAKALVNVEPEENKHASFISITTAMSSADTAEIVLKHALAELETFENKYRSLKELADVFAAIDKVREKIA